jgi:hypothetical protein
MYGFLLLMHEKHVVPSKDLTCSSAILSLINFAAVNFVFGASSRCVIFVNGIGIQRSKNQERIGRKISSLRSACIGKFEVG